MSGLENPVAIRPEAAGDELAIHALTEAAFRDMPFSNGSEPGVIKQLRQDGDLVMSLVALNMDQAIVGHLAFSPVSISDGTTGWYAGGPLSVIPLSQSSGIGSALIERGIADMRERGVPGCVLLGSPEFYGRFGFTSDPSLTFGDHTPEYFQYLTLSGDKPSGEVTYAPAFA